MLLVTAAAASAVVPVGTPGPYNISIKPAVKYALPAADTLIECKPMATPGHFAGPLPAVLLIHGGAWEAGSNAIGPGYTGSSASWCSLWASWGFDAFAVGYRLTGAAAWPAQIVDVQAAIRWVRANARTLNVNNGLIAVDGDSAGGQLAMIAGYSYANVPGDLASNNAGMDPHPQLVISQFGPWTFGPANSSTASTRASDYAAGILLDNADGRTQRTTPDTLFLQGTRDTTVNQCTQSEPAFRFLTSNKRPASYLAYPGGHEFTGMSGPTWAPVVGRLQLQTISFAYLRAHYTGALPASEAGPMMGSADASLPVGCP